MPFIVEGLDLLNNRPRVRAKVEEAIANLQGFKPRNKYRFALVTREKFCNVWQGMTSVPVGGFYDFDARTGYCRPNLRVEKLIAGLALSWKVAVMMNDGDIQASWCYAEREKPMEQARQFAEEFAARMLAPKKGGAAK